MNWHNLNCKINDKEILKNVSGHTIKNELNAILGPSGSGKTTLINILSKRMIQNKNTIIEGTSNIIDNKIVGFVEQENEFFAFLTIKEILNFSIELKMNKSLKSHKQHRLLYLLKKLNLEKCRNTKVGNGFLEKGISGGEKKDCDCNRND